MSEHLSRLVIGRTNTKDSIVIADRMIISIDFRKQKVSFVTVQGEPMSIDKFERWIERNDDWVEPDAYPNTYQRRLDQEEREENAGNR